MPEVLFSRPLLQAIGFDLNENLRVVRDKFHDCEFSHIGFAEADPASTVACESDLKGIPSSVTSSMWSRVLMTFHSHLLCFVLSLDHFRHRIRPQHGSLPHGRTYSYVGHLDVDSIKAL